jgi:hypothetical protein
MEMQLRSDTIVGAARHDVRHQASVDGSRQAPATRSRRSAASIVGELVKNTS